MTRGHVGIMKQGRLVAVREKADFRHADLEEIYLAAFFSLGLLISCLTRHSSTSLVLSLSVWTREA